MAKIDATRKQVLERNIVMNKWAIAALACFVCCALSVLLLNVIDAWMALGIIALFGIATFICATRIESTSKTEQLHVMGNPSMPSHEKLAEGLKDGFVAYGRDGSPLTEDTDKAYVMSSDVNRLFTTQPIWADVDEELYRFPTTVLPYTAYLKDARNRNLSKFAALRPDKAVMGLGSNIDLGLFEDEHPSIKLHHVTRYAVQVTDDAFDKLIINKKKISDKIVFDGHALCLDSEGHLIPFSQSEIANEVDIHSLIISNDGYIMFTRGTREHPLRPDKVIASAACSFLPTELEDRPVQEAMIESIHNKINVLYELPAGTDIKSSFCGFARMLQRGGAPEFYCITRLDMSKDEILKAHRDPTRSFIYETLKASVPELDSVEDAADYIATAAHSLRTAVGDDISLSASAMLTAIIDAMCDVRMAGKVLRRIGVIPDEMEYISEHSDVDPEDFEESGEQDAQA